MAELNFRKFTPQDASQFKALNVEWLEKYFKVEPIDERVLGHPQEEIIAQGGFIVMAELENTVIGTFAFIKKEEKLFEFSKMAIDPKHRGKGFGNVMMQFAITFAENHHWSKIVLYSSRILENSIHLYRKYGFIEVPMEPDVIYARGNIKMELELN
ncbi:MAG: GNAT family N-acetyltransferase [Flavobacteriaceae bacterium]|jgi:Predicted acetyltransferase